MIAPATAPDTTPADVSADRMRRVPPDRAVRVALALRRRLLALADRVIPSEFALFDQVTADLRSAAIASVAHLRIADRLVGGPRTAADLAAEAGVDADALHRVMRALVVSGVFTLGKDGRFGLTRVGRALQRDHPNSMHAWAAYWSSASNRAAWNGLDEVVRTGEPGFPAAHGMSVWQWFDEHPEEGRGFAAAMRRLTEIDAPEIVDRYPWPVDGVVCDLAGGAGTLLSRLLQAKPAMRGVLVEAPIVLAEAERVFAARGVTDRVELVTGDLFGTLPATRADVCILKNILHDWDDDTCGRILRNAHSAMRPGATLVVIEMLQERNRASYPSSLVDLQMMVVCDRGRERSADELNHLLRGAGFAPTSVHAGPTGLGLVAATA